VRGNPRARLPLGQPSKRPPRLDIALSELRGFAQAASGSALATPACGLHRCSAMPHVLRREP
jgi:hypothetical protein